jgi:putative colanic acid biosynthesis acetyltransferase WcaF
MRTARDEPVSIPGAPLSATGVGTFKGLASFPFKHRLLRFCFAVAWKLFASWTPPKMRLWRVFLVNLFGGNVHTSCSIYSSVRIWYPPNLTMARYSALGPGVDCYSMGPITIGEFAVISQRAFLCTGTHDIQQPEFQIVARPIHVGANAWIAAEAFIAPGVSIGEGAVLSARGAAFRDLEPWSVYRGNPATKFKSRVVFYRE